MRFIPAHAGNTLRSNPAMRSLSGLPHPRARGEHSDTPRRPGPTTSVHPRACGEHAIAIAYFPRRFIPAHAGNTPAWRLTSTLTTVHPRACGEHQSPSGRPPSAFGSSPRMRGTLVGDIGRFRLIDGRFIPAHAGNACPDMIGLKPLAVHPRACGEHLRRLNDLPRALGSSPRMRGNTFPAQPSDMRVLRRFIPAHAGNTHRGSARAPGSRAPGCPGSSPMRGTLSTQGRRRSGWFIPRACGEHGGSVAATTHDIVGSSPPMRGTRGPAPAEIPSQCSWRFIPAHAGNTFPGRRSVALVRPVHSPRMRGTLNGWRPDRYGDRFILAHEGEHPGPRRSNWTVLGSSPRM